MSEVILDEVVGGYQSAQATNENYKKIEEAFRNRIDADGSVPMRGDLDLGGYRIINQANVIRATAFNWTGPWAQHKKYEVGDVTETGSISYICIEEHTSGLAFEADIEHWQLLAGAAYPNVVGLRWKGEWLPFTDYILGDVVKNVNDNYVCMEVHTSGPTFTGLEWDQLAEGFSLPEQQPGDGDILITTGSIVKWGRVTAGNITTASLSAITTVTGTLQVDSSGYIAGGTVLWNEGNGFWMGYHGGAYKFSIGNASGQNLVWDGTNLTFTGQMTAGSISINNKFIVDSAGNTTIRNATTGARLVMTNSLVSVYDSSNVLRVRMGLW